MEVCLKAKHSIHSLEVPQASTSLTGASEPLYFDDQGATSIQHSYGQCVTFKQTFD